jgi:hypothetical protein
MNLLPRQASPLAPVESAGRHTSKTRHEIFFICHRKNAVSFKWQMKNEK